MKDRVIQKTDANVGKMATARVNVDKEGASELKKKLSDVIAVMAHLQRFRHRYSHVTCNNYMYIFSPTSTFFVNIHSTCRPFPTLANFMKCRIYFEFRS